MNQKYLTLCVCASTFVNAGLKYSCLNQSQVVILGGAAKAPPQGGEQPLWKITVTHPDHDSVVV